MAKKTTERHTSFISVVFKPADDAKVRAAADREHMKVSAWIRKIVLEKVESLRRRK